MKNLFFIFLIAISLFSCAKESVNPQFFDLDSDYYLNAVFDKDSVKNSIGNNWLSRFYSIYSVNK